MNVYISDYAAAHVGDDELARLIDLPYSDRVVRVAADSADARRALMRAALEAFFRETGDLDPDTVVVEVNQTRGPSTSVFGSSPMASTALEGRSMMLSSACASGVAASILAARIVNSGRAPGVLVIGSSAPSRGDRSSFSGVGAEAKGVSVPFDSRTTGVRLGAFAGAILFSASPGRRLPRQIGVVGHGSRLTGAGAASRSGDQVDVMRSATRSANRRPDVVVAHGTGTVQGDAAELQAIAELAESSWSGDVQVVSQKGGLGHTVHAAGLAAIISACESIQKRRMHGSYGLTSPIPVPDNVRLPMHGESWEISEDSLIMVNGFGFGGSNYSLLLQDLTKNNEG